MKTLGVRASRRCFPNSNRGASIHRGSGKQVNLAPSGTAKVALVAKVSDPFAHVDWNFAACFRKRPRPTALSQTRGIASRLPINFSSCKNIWDLRPPVSVEGSMREIKRTQQQPIPTYRGSSLTRAAAQTWPQVDFGSRFWQPVFALLRGSFSRICSVLTFT